MSFRSKLASAQKVQGDIEDHVESLTMSLSSKASGVATPSSAETKPKDGEGLGEGVERRSEQEVLNEDFRVALGAFVKGRQKLGVRCKFDLTQAQKALDEGADCNSVDLDGWTALHWAVSEGYGVAVKWLVNVEGINLDAQDSAGCTSLWVAGYNGQYQTAVSTFLLSPIFAKMSRQQTENRS